MAHDLQKVGLEVAGAFRPPSWVARAAFLELAGAGRLWHPNADEWQYYVSGRAPRLLPALMPHVDIPRALLRGRYMAAAAVMEHNGVPIDVPTLELFRRYWNEIKDCLIAAIDASYGVFDGRTFKADRFAVWLAARDIPWPRLESGRTRSQR